MRHFWKFQKKVFVNRSNIHLYTTIQHTLHLLSMLYNPRGLQSWAHESHHFYTLNCKVYSYTLSMSVYTHLIYTTIQHTLHLLSMLYKSTTLGDFRAGLSRATISIQYTTLQSIQLCTKYECLHIDTHT